MEKDTVAIQLQSSKHAKFTLPHLQYIRTVSFTGKNNQYTTVYMTLIV